MGKRVPIAFDKFGDIQFESSVNPLFDIRELDGGT